MDRDAHRSYKGQNRDSRRYGRYDVNPEWQPLPHLVEELHRGALIADIVYLQYPDAYAIVNGSEMIEPFCGSGDAFEELDVHLQAMAWPRLFVAFPALAVGLVLLVVHTTTRR